MYGGLMLSLRRSRSIRAPPPEEDWGMVMLLGRWRWTSDVASFSFLSSSSTARQRSSRVGFRCSVNRWWWWWWWWWCRDTLSDASRFTFTPSVLLKVKTLGGTCGRAWSDLPGGGDGDPDAMAAAVAVTTFFDASDLLALDSALFLAPPSRETPMPKG